MAAHGLVNGMSGVSPTGMSEANLPRPLLRRARYRPRKMQNNSDNQAVRFPCLDGATPSIITRYHTNVYKTQCGFLAKKSPQIHAKIKRYLIINELQDSPWHRPAAATQYVTPETLTTVPPQRPPIRNSEDAYHRRKISTFLAGVIPDTFAVEF